MTIRVVTFWSTLMLYAKELGQAKISGDSERIAEAQAKHDNYRDLCLTADEMILDLHEGGSPWLT